MQPLATDVRYLTRMYVDGYAKTDTDGDLTAHYARGRPLLMYFFPGAKTATLDEPGISVAESSMVAKVPWTREFRPGDRLADRDGRMLWEVVSETTYPGHQRLELRPL